MRKRVDSTLERIADGTAQMHNIVMLPGHRSTEIGGRIRVIHRPNKDGSTHFAALVEHHDYDKAIRGLAAIREAEGEHAGIMVAIVPPASVVEDLVLEEGAPADEIHMTLAFLGKTGDYGAQMLADLPEVIRAWAEGQKPMEAKIHGVGTFLPTPSSDAQHVLWAVVDSPGLSRVHVSLVDYLRAHGYTPSEEHAFSPHITLAYGKHHFRFMPKIEHTTFDVLEVWVAIGAHWESFPLGS